MSLFWTAKVRFLGYFYSVKDGAVAAGQSACVAVRDARDTWRRKNESRQREGKNEQMSNGKAKKTKGQLARLSTTVCGIEFCYAAETGESQLSMPLCNMH